MNDFIQRIERYRLDQVLIEPGSPAPDRSATDGIQVSRQWPHARDMLSTAAIYAG